MDNWALNDELGEPPYFPSWIFGQVIIKLAFKVEMTQKQPFTPMRDIMSLWSYNLA